MQEMRSQEDPLEEGMATHSSILAWRIPRTEEPGGLQSMRIAKTWKHLSGRTYTRTSCESERQRVSNILHGSRCLLNRAHNCRNKSRDSEPNDHDGYIICLLNRLLFYRGNSSMDHRGRKLLYLTMRRPLKINISQENPSGILF